jgi:hypothetical protein
MLSCSANKSKGSSMNVTTAEQWISQKTICHEKIGDDWRVSDYMVEEGPAKSSKILSITDRFMVLLQSRTWWRVPKVLIRCRGGITEKSSAYDDVARLEQEKNDLIERLKVEIKKTDAKRNHILSISSVRQA